MIFEWLKNKVPKASFVKARRNDDLQYAVDERMLENDLIEIIRDLQWKKILVLE